jgi:predicted nucleotidyltransferase/sulfur transfer complex TusBCD TusB component (DsrH family)
MPDVFSIPYQTACQPQSLFWIGSKMNHVEQNLINEIVALLIKEDLHTRAIADQLSSNHATVLRKLRDLTEENIVDFRMEGKNKVFTLKRTIEGRNAAMIAEIYKQSSVVRRYPVLRGIVRAIQEMPEIPLAILYGSYAKGLPIKGSDIDIYIETSDSSRKKQLEQKHSLLSVKIGAFDTKNLLIREIRKDHVIIRGVEAYFDKTGFFKETA